MNIEELIAALEAATGPSWDLDAEIWLQSDGLRRSGNVPSYTVNVPYYTSSLDAALTLVPKGWAWMTGCAPGEGFFAELQTMEDGGPYREASAVASSAPIALCIAALRARQARP